MPLPSPNFVYCPPLQIYFVDKDTAQALSAGVVTFYSDVNRTVLKPIYQQVQLPDNSYSFVQLNNPVTLTSVGTFADDNGNDIDIYLYPYEGLPTDATRGAVELYYITVYSSGGVLQITREAFPPNLGAGSNPLDTFQGSENQIANPQFVEILFTPSASTSNYTFSVAGSNLETIIAPDWSVITSGTGTVTVQQVAIADQAVPTNPPYVLDITSTGAGLTDISLRQRLSASPRLFYSGFVSGSFIAASQEGLNVLCSMNYVASAGTPSTFQIASDSTPADGSYKNIQGTAAISGTSNTATAPTGYVDIDIILQPLRHLRVSSVQLVAVASLESSIDYLQESTARQIDHLFHYYKPELIYKPIPSYLVGWDFPLNPAQPAGASSSIGNTGANKSYYMWDQTIGFQTVNSSVGYARNSSTNGLQISVASNSSFAIIQYLEAAQAREILSQRNSVQLKASVSAGTLLGSVTLWWTTGATLPDMTNPNYNSLVSTITSGIPTAGNLAGGQAWNQVARPGFGNAIFTLDTTDSVYSFSEFDPTIAAGGTTATFFAIVIAFDTMPSSTTMTLDYCSLVGGDIATRPAPQTPDEVMRECEYYYEQSYLDGSLIGTSVSTNARFLPQMAISLTGSNNVNLFPTPWELVYRVPKRYVPVISIYSIGAGASGNADAVLYYALVSTQVFTTLQATVSIATFWSPIIGTKSVNYSPITIQSLTSASDSSSTANFASGAIYIQYVADARLGLV